jgi:hypothetical protein
VRWCTQRVPTRDLAGVWPLDQTINDQTIHPMNSVQIKSTISSRWVARRLPALAGRMRSAAATP